MQISMQACIYMQWQQRLARSAWRTACLGGSSADIAPAHVPHWRRTTAARQIVARLAALAWVDHVRGALRSYAGRKRHGANGNARRTVASCQHCYMRCWLRVLAAGIMLALCRDPMRCCDGHAFPRRYMVACAHCQQLRPVVVACCQLAH